MAFCITFGSHEFQSQLDGYEGVQAQCRNCGNWRTQCVSRWPWFTVCFVPVIPLATHKYKEIACATCNFHQDLKDRPDIRSRDEGGAQGPSGPQGYPLGAPGQPHPQQYGPPPSGQPGGSYASAGSGQPQYK